MLSAQTFVGVVAPPSLCNSALRMHIGTRHHGGGDDRWLRSADSGARAATGSACVAVNTIKAWISVLEATFQIIILRPYFANVGKRLVKTPKIYFTDVGTLCYLAGLRDPEHAAAGPMGGAIFETAVVGEIVKTLVHRGIEAQVYFWRTAAGHEVDVVVEADGALIPIEVKKSATPRPGMAASITAFRRDLGRRTAPGDVVLEVRA